MKFNVVTLFPERFESLLGVVGRAQDQDLLEVRAFNPRSMATDTHQTVDDRPFGGGDGMLMRLEPVLKCLEEISKNEELGKLVYLSPHGQRWSDAKARSWAASAETVTLICGRYGGIDHRLMAQIDEEISLGDFVLSGGELAAEAIIDSTARFLPGVLGNTVSSQYESFAEGLLEAPQFTRPRDFKGQVVPEVLLSGHHEKIEQWRLLMSLIVTGLRRPDLIKDPRLCLEAVEWGLQQDSKELEASGLSIEKLKGLKIELKL